MGVDLIDLAENMNKLRDLVNTEENFGSHKMR